MMGFSSQKYRQEQEQRPWKINPIWRGIGCVLMLLVPVMSWFGAALFIQSNRKIVLPWQLTKVISIPYVRIAQVDKLIVAINQYFIATKFVYGQIFFTIIFVIIGFGIITVIYAFMYQVAGPSRYGPFDIPPNKIKR